MGKLVKMNTVIIGMKGLGVEIAKNLILAGPASVTIVDPSTVEKKDLGANFYLEESQVGSFTRADSCVKKLAELNPYVKVQAMGMDQMREAIASGSIHVVCQTELLVDGKFVDP